MKNIITISREYGSGGYEIGQRVAKELGYRFLDKELIAELADRLMISESFVAAEETPKVKKNIFHENIPIFAGGDSEQAEYIFNEQGKFIVELAEQGNCVIAGRRADYYLRDNEDAFHIFFYADMDFRIDRICKTENCTPEAAEKKIRDMDKRRKTSYEYTTGRKWGDIHNYDRMIDTSAFGIDACVNEIVALIKGQTDVKS